MGLLSSTVACSSLIISSVTAPSAGVLVPVVDIL